MVPNVYPTKAKNVNVGLFLGLVSPIFPLCYVQLHLWKKQKISDTLPLIKGGGELGLK